MRSDFVPVQALAQQPALETIVREPEIRVYAHSRMLYWWPVWVCGYIMAALTHVYGVPQQIGGAQELFHPSSNLGVIFILALSLVMLITNVTVRGLASVIVILSLALIALALAYFREWDAVLAWMGNLKIHLNFGAYFALSTIIFGMWALTVVIFDHLSYWRITPGQVTHENIFGASSKSYDAQNMVLEKLRDDLFRHWFLGFGSGDLIIRPFGPQRDVIQIPNVFFLGSKVRNIEHMIAAQPEK
jgi:hypothetical protein